MCYADQKREKTPRVKDFGKGRRQGVQPICNAAATCRVPYYGEGIAGLYVSVLCRRFSQAATRFDVHEYDCKVPRFWNGSDERRFDQASSKRAIPNARWKNQHANTLAIGRNAQDVHSQRKISQEKK